MEIGFLCDFSSCKHVCISKSFGHRIVETVNWIFGPISGTQRSSLLSKQRHAPVGPEGWQPAVRIPEANESDVLNKGNTNFLATHLVHSVPVKGIKHWYCGSLASHFRSRHVPPLPIVRRVEQKCSVRLFAVYLVTLSVANFITQHRIIGWCQVMNWKGCERKPAWPCARYYWDIHMEGLKVTEKHFRHDNRCPGRNSNRARPEV